MKPYPSNPGKVRAANIKAEMVRRRRHSDERLPFETNCWTQRVWRPLLIALLATALGTAFLTLLTVGTPEFAWLLLVPLFFIFALEGTYTAAWLGNPESFGVDKAVYRVTEMIVILMVARVVSWLLFAGGIPSLDDLRLLLQSPTAILLTGGFLSTALSALVVWWFASSISALFNQLGVSPYELDFYTLSAADQKERADDKPIGRAREKLQTAFLQYWVGGAIVIVLLTALSTFEVRELATVANPFDFTRLGLEPSMLVALLVYFMIGFWLLSHARLLRMNASWLMEGVAKDAAFEASWQRNSLLLLLAIGFIASFLPIGSTVPIARVLEFALSGVGYLLNVINMMLAAVLASFLALLATMMGGEEQTTPAPLLETPEFQPPPQGGETAGTLGMIVTSAFWALMLAGIVAATLFFLRERGYRFDRQSLIAGWSQLRQLLAAWWLQATGRAQDVGRRLSRALQSGLPQRSTDASLPEVPRWRFIRVNALAPREQVRYFYLSTVRRAQQSGVERRQDETPLEFARDLKGGFPDAEEDVEALTQAFLKARYSDQGFDKDDIHPIKERWQRLKARLRQARFRH